MFLSLGFGVDALTGTSTSSFVVLMPTLPAALTGIGTTVAAVSIEFPEATALSMAACSLACIFILISS